ncbi:helix-hairpin-helix domain-containing protein [Mariniblastus sp.]|nr:helix-hairpin-helix domain-containing protein [Mariniblastus sp.]
MLAERIKSLGLLFAQSEQKLIVAFLLASLLGIAFWSWRYSTRVEQIIDIDRRSSQTAAFQIDLNNATWMEISNLPGIGDQLAQDIVAYRESSGRFTNNEAIQLVSGIGPRTYAQIAPFLTQISSDPASMAATPSTASKR